MERVDELKRGAREETDAVRRAAVDAELAENEDNLVLMESALEHTVWIEVSDPPERDNTA